MVINSNFFKPLLFWYKTTSVKLLMLLLWTETFVHVKDVSISLNDNK